MRGIKEVNENVCLCVCVGGDSERSLSRSLQVITARKQKQHFFVSHLDEPDRKVSKVQLMQVARSQITTVFRRTTAVRVVLLTSSMRRYAVQTSGMVAGLESIRFHYGSDQCPTARTTLSVPPNTALIKYKTLARRNKTHSH